MGINPERAMFEALNIISKSADKYKNEKLEKPVDIVYQKSGMIYNGKYINYPEGHIYDPETGFTINGEPRSMLYFSTKEYVFITNSKQFEYYIDINDLDKSLSSIKAAWISFTKLMMSGATDVTLVTTSDCTDILIVDGSKYDSYGEFKLTLNASVLELTQIYIVTMAMKLINNILNDCFKLSEAQTLQYLFDYVNNIRTLVKTTEAAYISVMSGIDVPEKVIDTVFGILLDALEYEKENKNEG